MNNVQPKNPILWIKYKLLEQQWDRILRKHTSWERYFRMNDPDYSAYGHTVKTQLYGYPYIALVPHAVIETTYEPMFGPIQHASHIRDWCERHCKHKYRWHWERVIVDHNGQYLPNGIGGTDELFFGFKNRRDFLMFSLRWS